MDISIHSIIIPFIVNEIKQDFKFRFELSAS